MEQSRKSHAYMDMQSPACRPLELRHTYLPCPFARRKEKGISFSVDGNVTFAFADHTRIRQAMYSTVVVVQVVGREKANPTFARTVQSTFSFMLSSIKPSPFHNFLSIASTKFQDVALELHPTLILIIGGNVPAS